MGLLGHALAIRAGMTYEELLRKKICTPLAMNETRITLDDALTPRLAAGHDSDLEPYPNWDLPTLAGAGAIRSTAHDMLKFLAAEIGLSQTPLAAAIKASHVVQYKNPKGADNDVALAWMVRRSDGLIWHNGQTGGYHSFVGFLPKEKRGVVVLSNTAASEVDGIGFGVVKLLAGGEAEPPRLVPTIKLTAEELEPLVGSYQDPLAPNVSVTRDGERLFLQLPGQPKVRLYPESKTRFVCRLVAATVTFDFDDDGTVKQLVIHQNGQDVPVGRKR